jgi:hypothetical protein
MSLDASERAGGRAAAAEAAAAGCDSSHPYHSIAATRWGSSSGRWLKTGGGLNDESVSQTPLAELRRVRRTQEMAGTRGALPA